MFPLVAVTTIFVATYFFIVSERLHRTTIALAGALAVLLLPGLSLSQEEAVGFIDFNTLGLLVGMMLMVAVLKRTGAFRFLALRVAKRGRGRILLIFAGFAAITAASSALIDNVTTVLMIVPVIYLVSDLLGKNVMPFLVMVIIMANVGGMATLIGDPPNILVGSRAVVPGMAGSLTFMDFLANLGPLALVCVVISLVYLRLAGSKEFFAAPVEAKSKALESMDATQAIKDTGLLRRTLAVLVPVLLGFLFHHELGLEPATVALAGAALLLVVTRIDPEELLVEVEWGVLFFFIGLFVLVGALEKVGVVDHLARAVLSVSDSPAVLMVVLLWGTALTASLISAVPTVTVLIPMVQIIVNHHGAGEPGVALGLWWALAAGACLGGNATVVGAAANMAVVGLSSKEREPLSFARYARMGVPVTALCLVVTTAYVLLRYR
ncbi:MAG TPA: SLC13 family permease, partial [bacterium]|nr:SLC13 family permease [bacterium]